MIWNVSDWLSYAGGALFKVADSASPTVHNKQLMDILPYTGIQFRLPCIPQENFSWVPNILLGPPEYEMKVS